jgi:hypothetical protein
VGLTHVKHAEERIGEAVAVSEWISLWFYLFCVFASFQRNIWLLDGSTADDTTHWTHIAFELTKVRLHKRLLIYTKSGGRGPFALALAL